MFSSSVPLRPPPLSLDVLTANGQRRLQLQELVINRREWFDYLNYLNQIDFKSLDRAFLSNLTELTWNAILTHHAFDKSIENILYNEMDLNEMGQKMKDNVKLIKKPPSFQSLFKERKENEILLQEAVKLRKLWVVYSDSLSNDLYSPVEFQNAVKEKGKCDEFIDKLLEKMYCSYSNIEQDSDEDSSPRKKMRQTDT